MDGRTIFGRCEYYLSLAGHKAGDTLQIELLRGDRSLEATLVLDPRSKPNGATILRQRFGLAAEPLREEKAYATRLRVHRGVVITGVAPGAYSRLKNPPMPGDVLARINNIRPRDLDQVGMLLDRVKPGEQIHFVLLRMKDHEASRVDIVMTLAK